MVEDDPELAAMLTDLLTGEGYAVELATDGQRGLHLGLTREFDLMLLDRGLPAIEGLDLLARLRARGRYVPTLVLSALGQPSDRVDGLDAGAEDYLGKPFDVDELLARLRALLRRPRDHADVLPVPGGELDLSTRSVLTESGGEVALSEREAMLLIAAGAQPAPRVLPPRAGRRACSRPPRRKGWWTPTSTTCAASSTVVSWRRCVASGTGWEPGER